MFDHLTPGERRHLGAAVHESSHSICAVVHNATIDRAEVLRGGPLTRIVMSHCDDLCRGLGHN